MASTHTNRSLFRSKSFSPHIYGHLALFGAHCLYINKGFILFKMCTYISMYLFHIGLMPSRYRGEHPLLLFKGSILRIQELLVLEVHYFKVIRLAPSIVSVFRPSPNTFDPLFRIELPYSHNLLFRLFFGLMSINPVFLLINLCQTKVGYISSFYYEYSYLSIFGKQSTNANGHQLLHK
jgi:hypothetical protein